MRAPADLVPFARNSRTHSPEQVEQLAASIREFGFTAPVLVDADGGILAGHGRVLAAQLVGLAEVPTVELAHLTPEQRRAYVIADNRLAELAGWDTELLGAELSELRASGYDVGLAGFSASDMDSLFPQATKTEPSAEGEADPDVPDAPGVPVTRPGDLWQIGPHSLICGDSTSAAVVAALMGDERARLCFTSPPYGNQRDYTGESSGDWLPLMRGVFAALPMADDGQVLVNLGLVHRDNEVVPYWQPWLEWMGAQGWRRFGWYVWDQGPGTPGDWWGRLAPAFEFVFHFNKAARKPNKIVPCVHAGSLKSGSSLRDKEGNVKQWSHGVTPTQAMRIPDSVIRVMRHKGKIGAGIDHPAVFPVALPQFIIEAYTDPGDVLFEPFNGSGSTMLAAHRVGRLCRSVEIAPAYCDVALIRFGQQNPGVPIKLAATGQTFAEVKAERETVAA